MILKAGFKKYNTNPCILYRVNALDAIIVIAYVDSTLEIGDKPESMNTIELKNK